MNLTKSKTAKLVSVFVGFAMALSFVVTPVTASAATAEELQAQISSLLATIQSLQAQLSATTGGSSTVATGYTFNTNLTVGSRGTDVLNLQKVLNSSADTKVASTGAGSPGSETTYFGNATKAAVIKFQIKNGITPAAGYVGAITRAKLNSMNTTTGTTTGGTTGGTTLPTGGNLTVTAGTQPSNSLAPANASRVPFTNLTLTAGSSDVTVNSITVERVGLAVDSVFAGVVLLDSNGMQIGVAKTLNSNHQANVGEPFVIKAGTSQTVTVAGNMQSLANGYSNYAGQVAGLNVVAINTTATVAGSLPISGAQQTINASLTLGSAQLSISSYDPTNASQKEIGTTGYKFAGVRVTSGSVEAVKLYSVRWNQSGSASSNDLSNVKVYVDGTAYDTTVSADGKYYSAIFPGGILIDKGLGKDVWIQGDITGTGSAVRTVEFDLAKNTDLYMIGQTFGYGIIGASASGCATTATTGSEFINSSAACATSGTIGTPFFSGSVVTITAGSVTTIGKATTVAAQNIAVNVPNQVLGGFIADIKGEPISVQQMIFNVATTGTWTSSTPITGITIVNESGAIVAGPVDEPASATNISTVTFSDTVTFPIGLHTYTIKGKIPTGAPQGATVILSTTPSSQWTGVTGQVTGNTITLTNGAFSMNTMTVRTAAFTVSVASSPVAQSVVSGGKITFANIQFDASQSGEDVKFSQVPMRYNTNQLNFAPNPSYMSGCQFFDGATALNTGSNVPTLTSVATTTTKVSNQTFTFDSPVTVTKGTVKTLTFKCDVSSTVPNNSTMEWGMDHDATMTVTGVTSGSTVSQNIVSAPGQIMTAASGYFTVGTASDSPSYTVVAAGTSGNVVGKYKFRAFNESVNLNKIGLTLTGASSSPNDLVQVSIWDGTQQVGTATFTGSNTVATSTFNTPVLLTKDVDKVLTIKADLAGIGSSETGTEGHLIKIDLNTADTTGTEGAGVQSGSTINLATTGFSGSTSVAGIRMFKTYPTFAKLSVPTNTLNNGQQKLLRYSVTASPSGDVGIYKFSLSIATTTATVTDVNIRAYTDAGFSTPISGVQSDGSLLATPILASGNTTWASSATELNIVSDTIFQIPAGQTRYFEVVGTVGSANTAGATVQTQLLGDANYPYFTGNYFMAGAASSSVFTTAAGDDFIWSPNATSTSVAASDDWTNGFGLVGLPSSAMSSEVLSR